MRLSNRTATQWFRSKIPFICAVLVLGWGTAGAEVRLWQVGGEGLTWESQGQSSAITFDIPGTIQLVGFTSEENIVDELNWVDDTPIGFITERDAHVWDNVALKKPNLPIVDGDPSTSTEGRFKVFGVSQTGTNLFFDLGTRFPANRILFFPRQEGTDEQGRPFAEDFIRNYDLFINGGTSFNQQEAPVYSLLKRVDFTSQSIAEIIFPLQFIRYIQLKVLSATPFELAEFQVYGNGFAPRGLYRSEVIDLGEVANFSRLMWEMERLRQEGDSLAVEAAADARVSVIMRTGRDNNPNVYHQYTNLFTKESQVVSEDEYENLPGAEQGPIEEDQVDWSLWSTPFTTSGQVINLPSPRQWFQFQINLESQAILDGVRVTSLDVEYIVPPVAQGVIGEVSEQQDPRPAGNVPVVPAGVFSSFVYDIEAEVVETDTGFDGLRIFTPSSRPVFTQFLMGDALAPVSPDSVAEELGSLTLFFPSNRVDSPQSLRVLFDAEVFVQGTFINAEVFDSETGDAPQLILAGDANPEVGTNGLRILTSAESIDQLLPFFQVAPRILTPNGDGTNDGAEIFVTLVQLVRSVDVRVEIFDLAGRRVRRVFTGEAGSGAHNWAWNGCDDSGSLVPVGIYLVVVKVDTQRGEFVRTGSLGVVY